MQAYLPLPNEYDELGSNIVMSHLKHKFDPNLLKLRISKTTRVSVSVFFQHDFSSSVFSCVMCISLCSIIVVDHTFLFSMFACISRGDLSWC